MKLALEEPELVVQEIDIIELLTLEKQELVVEQIVKFVYEALERDENIIEQIYEIEFQFRKSWKHIFLWLAGSYLEQKISKMCKALYHSKMIIWKRLDQLFK